MIVRPKVDLPHPDSPTRPNVSPSYKSKVISSTALTHGSPSLNFPFFRGKYFLSVLLQEFFFFLP